MNNYYAEFNLNKDDSLESIRDSLFKEKKKWANRANNPNMETRQKAEQKLQLLEEAALVFSDKYKKEEYDSELSKSGDSATQTQQQPVQQEQTTSSIDIAKYYYDNEDLIHTIDFCQKQINGGDNHPDLYWYLGLAYADIGRIDDSVNTFEKVISLYPELPGFYTNLAAICVFNQYKVETALDYADKAIALDPLNSFYLYNKVRCLCALKRLEEAEEIVKNHLEKYPNDEEFKKNVARAYLVYGNTFYENSNTPGSYIPNAQAYKMVKMSAEKAVEMHRDEETESALHATISRGKIEFNKDNLKGIAPFWAICLIFILMERAVPNICIFAVGTVISIALLYFSFKPVWMLEKMQLTGKRDLANTFSHVLFIISTAVASFVIAILGFVWGMIKEMLNMDRY